MANGSQIALGKGKSYQTRQASSNGEKLVYTNGNTPVSAAYNYLTIPRGGQFFVQLADGTKVWLNSESQLRYPVAFTDGKTREVELVYGEAYFEVSPSTVHKGARFKVLNKMQEVEVLGTQFNIKAYKDETTIYTTLVEGKVAMNTVNAKVYLAPSQQANLNLKNLNLSISRVDVYNEISWKKGIFSFERKPLKDIMVVLSRWYDVDVIFENKTLENAKFIGILGKEQPIEEILTTIKATNIINNYKIEGKTIYIK
ncbi:fec operon regulator FecR [compost metagenome]